VGRLRKLQEAQGKLHEQMEAILVAAETEDNGAMSDERLEEYDKLQEQYNKQATAIEREKQHEDRREKLATVEPRKTTPDPVRSNDIHVGKDRLADDPSGGYGDHCGFGAFAADVKEAARNPAPERLRKWDTAIQSAAGDGMTSTVGSEGGYLIPVQFGALIDRIALEAAVVRPRATKIPMSSQRVNFPCVDDTSHSTTVFGGVRAYFRSEEALLTESKPAFSEVELSIHKLTGLAYVSGEMLDWSPVSIDAWLPQKLAQAIAWKEDHMFINGNGGSGEPVGLLNSTCILSIAKEKGQVAATIVFENILKMDSRIWDGSGRGSIVWIANRTCKKQLSQLHLVIGAAGIPVFLPAGGAVGQPSETLYGYPILWTEHAQALGTVGDLLLCNLAEYLVGDASSKTRSDRTIALKFDYDQTAYRVITYTGGVMSWRSAFTPQHGDTLSPILSLATRS